MNNKTFCGTENDFVTEVCGLFQSLNYMIKLDWYLVYKNSAGAEADLALIEK